MKWYTCVDAATYTIERFEKTEEGYVVCYGVAAKVGVMAYDTALGPIRDFVPAETLRASAKSLVNKPLTMEHPPSLINARNAKKYRIGVVLDAWFDEGSAQQRVKLLVDEADAVGKIERREITQLSPGYRVQRELVKHSEYERVQISRENNHLALTKTARGGIETAIQLDSADNVCLSELNMEDELDLDGNPIAKDAFPAPGAAPAPAAPAPAPAPAPAAPAPAGQPGGMGAMIMAKLDQILAAVGTAAPAGPTEPKAPAPAGGPPEEKPAMDATHPAFIAAFNERTRVVEAAKRLGMEVTDADTTDSVLRKVVASQLPNVELDSKSADYLAAAFDTMFDRLPVKNSIRGLEFDSNTPRKQNEDADKYETVDPTQLERNRKAGN